MTPTQSAYNTFTEIENKLAQTPKCKRALQEVRKMKRTYCLQAEIEGENTGEMDRGINNLSKGSAGEARQSKRRRTKQLPALPFFSWFVFLTKEKNLKESLNQKEQK